MLSFIPLLPTCSSYHTVSQKMSHTDPYKKNIKTKDATMKKSASLTHILLYGLILGYYLFTIVFHRLKLSGLIPTESPKYEVYNTVKKFTVFYFTIWNFTLQIIFLLLAVADEILKLAKASRIQFRIEKIRMSIFSTLVFPSSLMVAIIFWSIWHIDRELIFPKIIDQLYPAWMNHSLHTFIIVPLIIEVISRFKKNNFKISNRRAAAILITYCGIYQALYLSVYVLHGIWLYPIYKILTWSQRVLFTLGQLVLAIFFQQMGLLLVRRNESKPKIK